ncbi:amino acid adenylation domain-containing protein [Streptomyces luteogriseus]|uniref:non-ribosomal peptide synthetase n=1 Tax=Streptomyces luteogriseus TaxID=68233 RepID=UPI003803AA63
MNREQTQTGDRDTVPSRCFPMSREQESVWLNDQLQDGASRYLEPWVYRLRGPLDPGAVEEALAGIVARHEVLRTALELDERGSPRQRVLPPGPVRLVDHDVAERDLDTMLREVLTQPLPLDRPPLLRAHLLRTAPQDAVLAVVFHHAVIDGWSLRLLDEEFSELYRATTEGRASRLTPVPLQIGEYARRQLLRHGQDDRLSYWRETLKELPPETSLPGDRPRPSVLGPAGGQIEFGLDAALTARVTRTAKDLRTTPFAVLLAGLTALTVRLAGQDDVVIGTPVSARQDEELDSVVGCLSDVLPIRQRVHPGTTFQELLEATGERVWDALDHREVSLRELIVDLDADRSLSRFPLFQIVFTMDEVPLSGLRIPRIEAERLLVHGGTAKYDLFLALFPEGEGMRGLLEFSADLYDADTAARLMERYKVLLDDALARPEAKLHTLAVMPREELRLVTEEWAGTVGPAQPPSVVDLFHTHARQAPDDIAVIAGERQLSYRQLARSAGQLAGHLLDNGWAGRRIAIRLDRSPELLIAVLGVLSAGCAYVPLDPSYPPDRIAYMLADSDAALLIAEESRDGDGPVLRLRDVPARASAGADADSLRTVRPHAGDLAYVIYTSGSTGRPKGVAMPHGPLANLVDWQRRKSACGPGSRTLQFAPLSFDVSFQEIFSTWAAGGAVVVIPEDARRDPERLLDLMDRHGVDRLFLPYVALQQLAGYAHATGRGSPTLKEVVSAGEQLHVTPAIRAFFTHGTSAWLENQYGPSETHVVTAERLQGPASEWPERPAIGRPIDGVRLYLLDDLLRPVPPGVVGEIHVGGRAPALGYLGREELTGRAFPADPFLPGGRLYRTGDKGRHLPDGRIEYLGRDDGQVKVRGHRVEPGEVESALKAVPGVSDAVVLASAEEEPAPTGCALTGYYLCAEPGGVAPEAVRAELRSRLPEYSVPQRLVPIPEIPVTPSGKADRAALRALTYEPADPPADMERGAARTAEQHLAALWRRILGHAGGPGDDFFALGGDSLLAVRLVLAIREEMHVQLPMNSVYRTPTLAGLARAVEGLTSGPEADPADERLPADIRPAATVLCVATDPAEVLLTGATGFLGAFVLRELVDRTTARIHCLVRGGGPHEARSRLRRTLERYGLWDDKAATAVTVVPGDLGLPRLGLDDAVYDSLARGVDAVYHVGAAVNLAQTYAQARAANVLGTVELLRLAALHRTVPLHHVSTVGVFAGEEIRGRLIDADHPLPPADRLTHGYTQSKWAAERLVEEARDRGLPVSVHRPTRVVGHSRTGACQSRDFLWLLLRGCVEEGLAPDLGDMAFDLVPVDYVSRTIVALSRSERTATGRFHLTADELVRFDRLVEQVRASGFDLTVIPMDEWLARIRRNPENPAFSMLGVLTNAEADGDMEGNARFDCSSTVRALRGTGIQCPAFGSDSVQAHVAYFSGLGEWPLPRVSPTLPAD